jgi:hypothetical protein
MKPKNTAESETRGMILAIIFMSIFILALYGLAPYI